MLTLNRQKTVNVFATDNAGQAQKIEVTTQVGTVIPALTVPSILSLIRNTSVTVAKDMNSNTRYIAEVKAKSEVLISKSDGKTGTFTKDPRNLTASDLEVMVCELTPEMEGAKYRNIEWDGTVEGFSDLLGRKMASFIAIRRTKKSFRAIKELIQASEATQTNIVAQTATATNFDEGAHVEKLDINSSEDAYNLWVRATSNFQRIGTEDAIGLNKDYAHAEGIAPEDVFVIMSPEFEAKLLGKQGVFASQSGNELFRKAGITEVLGIQTTKAIAIPKNVHFIVVTTGANGTYGYEEVAGGEKGNILIDPDWSFAKRLDCQDTFTMGVVLPFQVFTAMKAGTTVKLAKPTSANTVAEIQAYLTQEGIDYTGKTLKADLLALIP